MILRRLSRLQGELGEPLADPGRELDVYRLGRLRGDRELGRSQLGGLLLGGAGFSGLGEPCGGQAEPPVTGLGQGALQLYACVTALEREAFADPCDPGL